MGVVYEGRHERLGTRSAVKILRDDFAHRPNYRERFLREARAAAKVKHPNIVDIFDFGETPNGSVYLAMEFLHGWDLRQRLRKRGPIPWPMALPLLLQAVDALSIAHAKGVIHRDVKPANCFLVGDVKTDGTLLKLLDFGIARITDERGARLTLVGQVVGTPAYMAPEVAIGKPADPRSDLYSLAVTTYQMLTGRLPFNSNNIQDVLTRKEVTPPRVYEPAIPTAVEDALMQALTSRREERFETVEAFGRALSHASAGNSSSRNMLVRGGTVLAMPLRPTPGSRLAEALGTGPESSMGAAASGASMSRPTPDMRSVTGPRPTVSHPVPSQLTIPESRAIAKVLLLASGVGIAAGLAFGVARVLLERGRSVDDASAPTTAASVAGGESGGSRRP